MIPKLTILGAAVLVAATLSSCKMFSNEASGEAIACNCGTPEADLEGCACSNCMGGDGNSDNPDCVCGPLSFELSFE